MICVAIGIGIPCCLVMGYTENVDLYIAAYVLAYGWVGGVAYMVPIFNTWDWFPKSPGLTSGLIIGSVGLGHVIFQGIGFRICNPDDV